MKVNSLSKEIENLEKKDLTVQVSVSKEKKTYSNLPQVRKVAIAKRRTKYVMLVALFVSCFSLSVYIGFIGPFLLFK